MIKYHLLNLIQFLILMYSVHYGFHTSYQICRVPTCLAFDSFKPHNYENCTITEYSWVNPAIFRSASALSPMSVPSSETLCADTQHVEQRELSKSGHDYLDQQWESSAEPSNPSNISAIFWPISNIYASYGNDRNCTLWCMQWFPQKISNFCFLFPSMKSYFGKSWPVVEYDRH